MREVVPETASTVLVLRERPSSLEVLCVRRHPDLRAWGGAVAFPGGKVDPCDADPAFGSQATPPHPRVFAFSDDPSVELACVVAAARELFEEAGLLAARGPCDAQQLRALRLRYKDGQFRSLLQHSGVVLDLAQLRPVARWVTPPAQPVRFDARFYFMALPVGQDVFHIGQENTECFWSEPTEILERFERRDLDLVPPTQWMLYSLSKFKRLDDFARFAARQPLRQVCPECSRLDGGVHLVLPGHPEHSQPEWSLEGPTSYDLREQRFVLNWKS
jgi:8-oxo-dGTP pyrophosphatase MutT (NUDIX family)